MAGPAGRPGMGKKPALRTFAGIMIARSSGIGLLVSGKAPGPGFRSVDRSGLARFYSYFSVSAGLAEAALTDWNPTVRRAMASVPSPVSTNPAQPIPVL